MSRQVINVLVLKVGFIRCVVVCYELRVYWIIVLLYSLCNMITLKYWKKFNEYHISMFIMF